MTASNHSENDVLSSLTTGRESFISGEELWNWWQWARQTAIAHDISLAEVDWLLQAFTDLDQLALRLGSFQHQPQLALNIPANTLKPLWEQRINQRAPVQYLAGKTSWREFSLQVAPAVLIPRPETELLIDLAVQEVRAEGRGPRVEERHWADLGTGSGAIALGLATVFPAATIHAVDVSGAALAIAQANAAAYQLTHQICFYQGSWLQPLAHLQGTLDGIVSNPPYIPSQQVLALQPEVAQHEPHLALDGGDDGLNCLRHLVRVAPAYLRSGGIWLVEMMAGQAETVANLLYEDGNYTNIRINKDLAGIERFAIAHRR
jgi:release factor glutamine methyltransferase